MTAATAVERLFPPDVIRSLDAIRTRDRRLMWPCCCRECAEVSR